MNKNKKKIFWSCWYK